MMPPRRRPWLGEDGDGLHVLVPGLFGVGFLISLIVLAFDAIAQLVPAAGRRRNALLMRDVHGRTNDLEAVASGRPPAPGAVPCEPRTRAMSALLGGIAATLSLVVAVVGFAAAAHVGVDRQAWTISIALVVAIPVGLVATMWLLSALLGAGSPRWLRSLQTVWPLGTYPRYDFDSQEAST